MPCLRDMTGSYSYSHAAHAICNSITGQLRVSMMHLPACSLIKAVRNMLSRHTQGIASPETCQGNVMLKQSTEDALKQRCNQVYRGADLDVGKSIDKTGCASEADKHFGSAPCKQYLHTIILLNKDCST